MLGGTSLNKILQWVSLPAFESYGNVDLGVASENKDISGVTTASAGGTVCYKRRGFGTGEGWLARV